ncbi:hypothetical protein HYX13_02775 [Candidatus Woesearchaeota archaeon]|nr:hypothetical protein [Candidatus Woesearchaeota archaeon]
MPENPLSNQESLRLLFGDREIETLMKKRAGKSLTQTERNYLSASIRPKLRAIQALAPLRLLSEINNKKQGISRSDIIFNLSRFGYELIIPYASGKGRKISLEELIVHILLSFPEARFIEAIPILLLKNKIDLFSLLEMATRWNLKNQLGFLLEIAFTLKKKKELENILEYLRRTKEKEPHLLGENLNLGEEYKEFLVQSSSPRMISWNLLGRFFDEDFKAAARTYL